MNRKQCLDAAAAAVLTDRQKLYGKPENGFAPIATMWGVILGRKIEPYEVALCMSALKIVRATNTPTHGDNWADLAGYAACGSELAIGDTSEPELAFSSDKGQDERKAMFEKHIANIAMDRV